MPKIVQFFHPGGETPKEFIKPESFSTISMEWTWSKKWKTGVHSRNFIKSPGEYVDASGQKSSDDLVFWGEWEAEACGVKVFGKDADPQRLIEPIKCKLPADKLPGNCGDKDCSQNTDPFVFGECFRYSYCKQHAYHVLKELDENSIILFGAYKNHKFLLDTVFVVGKNRKDYCDRNDLVRIPDYEDYCNYLVDLTNIDPNDKCVYYEGKTFSENEMYSFSPAKVYSESTGSAFSRIELDAELLMSFFKDTSFSDGQTQGVNFQKGTDFPKEVVRQGWERLKDFVLAQGCVLGVKFDIPVRTKKEVFNG